MFPEIQRDYREVAGGVDKESLRAQGTTHILEAVAIDTALTNYPSAVLTHIYASGLEIEGVTFPDGAIREVDTISDRMGNFTDSQLQLLGSNPSTPTLGHVVMARKLFADGNNPRDSIVAAKLSVHEDPLSRGREQDAFHYLYISEVLAHCGYKQDQSLREALDIASEVAANGDIIEINNALFLLQHIVGVAANSEEFELAEEAVSKLRETAAAFNTATHDAGPNPDSDGRLAEALVYLGIAKMRAASGGETSPAEMLQRQLDALEPYEGRNLRGEIAGVADILTEPEHGSLLRDLDNILNQARRIQEFRLQLEVSFPHIVDFDPATAKIDWAYNMDTDGIHDFLMLLQEDDADGQPTAVYLISHEVPKAKMAETPEPPYFKIARRKVPIIFNKGDPGDLADAKFGFLAYLDGKQEDRGRNEWEEEWEIFEPTAKETVTIVGNALYKYALQITEKDHLTARAQTCITHLESLASSGQIVD